MPVASEDGVRTTVQSHQHLARLPKEHTDATYLVFLFEFQFVCDLTKVEQTFIVHHARMGMFKGDVDKKVYSRSTHQ